MIINRIIINRFGKLSGENIELSDGINIVYGKNESGKSTLQGFILNMLFGMNRAKGRASRTDDFARFEPKEMPLEYSGSMEFSAGDRQFILSRDFAAGRRRDTLVAADDREVLSVSDGDLEQLLGETSREAYSNTQSVDQASETDTAYLWAALTDRYTQNRPQGTDIRGGVVSKSLKEMETARKNLEAQQRKALKARDEQAFGLKSQLNYIEGEIEELRRRLEEVKASVKNIASVKNMSEHEKLRTNQNKIRQGRRGTSFIAGALLFAAAAICIAVTLALDPDNMILMFAAGAAAISGIACLIAGGRRRYPEAFDDLEEDEETAHPELYDELRIRQQIGYLKETLDEKLSARERISRQYESILVNNDEISEVETRIKGMRIAEETLETIADRASKKHEKRFKEAVAKVFEYLSADENRSLVFDEEQQPVLMKNGIFIPFWQCSRGTKDLIDLAMRLAASDMLLGENMPLLLDDALVNCDDDRMKRILLFLKNKKRQVIIFTCHEREVKALNELGIRYNFVSWSGSRAAESL